MEDKNIFLKQFRSLVKRTTHSYNDLKDNILRVDELLNHSSKRIVLKNSLGQVGAEVEVLEIKDINSSNLLDYMDTKGYDLAEEYVEQHSSIMDLSSSGLNTVRIFTQWHNDSLYYLGARFRISVNSQVDNMGAGNLAAPVDLETGIVNGSGVYSDITKEAVDSHPVSGKPIAGFKLPFWDEVLELSRRAAELTPENRSVGWDIAITENGPELIEGNHNWCKLLWQLPVKQGLKAELKRFL